MSYCRRIVYIYVYTIAMTSSVDYLVERVAFLSWRWHLAKHPGNPCCLYEWEVQLFGAGAVRVCVVVILSLGGICGVGV
jgi:hypothetical protein